MPARARRWARLRLPMALALMLFPILGAQAAPSTVFSDGFETGNLSMWTASTRMTVQGAERHTGVFAARAVTNKAATNAYLQLAPSRSDVTTILWFKVISRSTVAQLFRYRKATGGTLLVLSINKQNRLEVQNSVTGAKITSATTASLGLWHELRVHLLVNGTSSRIDVSLDGAAVPDLSRNDSFGTTAVGRVQIGTSSTSQVFDVAFDDVQVQTPGSTVDGEPPSVPGGLRTTSVQPTSVTIAWDASTDNVGVTGYLVYRSGGAGPVTFGPTLATALSDTTVSPSSTYAYTVEAFDAAGNPSGPSTSLPVTTPGPDLEAPTTPGGLRTTAVTATRVDLAWDPSTDNLGVTGYAVSRAEAGGGTPMDLGGTAATIFSDASAQPSRSYTYTVEALDAAMNRSVPPASLDVPTPAAPASFEIAAGGDIACDPTNASFNGGAGTPNACRAPYTSELLVNDPPDAVLTLGDNQYICGSLVAFQASFEPSWGRVKPLIYPAPGNHEYQANAVDCDPTRSATGYFQYFGSRAGEQGKGYYSFDLGPWHLISLNSECAWIGGCEAGSPQELWLRQDLLDHPATCTLAYWHKPRFSSGTNNGSNTASSAFWTALHEAGADVVLNGHEHNYERFAPQSPTAAADPGAGIRQFVAGTGGAAQYPFKATPIANSEVRITGVWGVLRMTLRATDYDWSFVSEQGTVVDSGTGTCH